MPQPKAIWPQPPHATRLTRALTPPPRKPSRTRPSPRSATARPRPTTPWLPCASSSANALPRKRPPENPRRPRRPARRRRDAARSPEKRRRRRRERHRRLGRASRSARQSRLLVLERGRRIGLRVGKDVTQSSAAPAISSVNFQSPFIQQKFNATLELARETSGDTHEARFLAELQLWLAGFQAPSSNPSPKQLHRRRVPRRCFV